MGGVAKGMLEAPSGEPIVRRTLTLLERLGIDAVLVGDASAYGSMGARAIADDPGARGPMAGLLALLALAGSGRAVAIACDMPFVDAASIVRLCDAASGAAIVAPREDGLWQPLFARYDAPRVLPVARALAAERTWALQSLFARVPSEELVLCDEERRLLGDWDTPEDVAARR